MGASSTKADIHGQQILMIQPNSPCSNLGLHPYSDLIIAVDDVRLMRDTDAFPLYLKDKCGIRITLTVYNVLTEDFRNVSVVPSNNWGGKGLLGVSIIPNDADTVVNLVWHILEVAPKSPSALAGLKANEDYIIGSPGKIFSEEAEFYELVEGFLGKELSLYVYNIFSGVVREVLIIPNLEWGNRDSSLGCLLGTGILHRVPKNPPANVVRLDQSKRNSEDCVAKTSANPIIHNSSAKNAHPPTVERSQGEESPAGEASLQNVSLHSPMRLQHYIPVSATNPELDEATNTPLIYEQGQATPTDSN